MARARTIKPGFFTNDALAELRPLVRLLYAGLWTLADREGRLPDRPKKIKAEIMAYDSLDVDSALAQLTTAGFLIRYEVDGQRYIQVDNWLKHQHPHPREDPSAIPPVPAMQQASMDDAWSMHDGENRPQNVPRSGSGPEKVGTGPSRTSSSSSSGTSSSFPSGAAAAAAAGVRKNSELRDAALNAVRGA